VAVLAGVDDHLDRQGGELAHQAGDHGQGGVGFLAEAEDDLELGIVLQAEGAQVFVQARFCPAQGLEHRDGGEFNGGSGALAAPPDEHGHQGEKGIGGGEHQRGHAKGSDQQMNRGHPFLHHTT
jgi:hypothetical protein